MDIVAQTVIAMQAVLGETVDELARATGCVRRERKFSGSSLLRTLVLTLLQHPVAKDGDYRTVAAQLGIDVTDQAIQGRFTSGLVDFLRAALQYAFTQAVLAVSPPTPLLQKFTRVTIGDSTTITLPDALAGQFPGCGGSHGSGKAALKIQVLWNLTSGECDIQLEPGRAADVKSSLAQATPSAGSLSVLDLGYFSLDRFDRVDKAQAYYISRFKHGTQLFEATDEPLDLLKFLRFHQRQGIVDVPVVMGREERLACRLIAVRVPPEVSAQRRRRIRKNARDHGHSEPTQEYLDLQDWTIFITNCGPELLNWKEVVVLYRARWQIELLFKLWKSHNRIATLESNATIERRMAVLYAKLIGAIVQHWLLLSAVWQDGRRSLRRAAADLRDWLPLVTDALDNLRRLRRILQRLGRALPKSARVSRRKKHPSLFQLLENPELLEYKVS